MGDAFLDPYFLKSERLGFRWWTEEDFPLARGLWADIEVTRYFGGPFSDDEVRVRLERELERRKVYEFQYWPIFLLSDGEHVGCCGLRPYGTDAAVPELGFHLRPKFWGRGLAVEAVADGDSLCVRDYWREGISGGAPSGECEFEEGNGEAWLSVHAQ